MAQSSAAMEYEQHLRDQFATSQGAEPTGHASRLALSTQLHNNAEALRRMLCETNSQINELAPVSRLPTELLAVVFTLVAKLDPLPSPFNTDVTAPQHALAWVSLTHVCRYWRLIAFGDPALWSKTVGMLPRASTAFLERAGDHVPLRFFLSRGVSRIERPFVRSPLVDQLRAYAQRVESIQWHSLAVEEVQVIETALVHHTFDTLHYLRIATPQMPWGNDGSVLVHAKTLKTVHFQGFFVHLVAPQLTTLTLQSPGSRVDAEEALELLRSCPLLMFVELADLLDHFEQPEAPFTPVRLAHLNRLELELYISGREVGAFIECLDMPTTVELHVRKAGLLEAGDYTLFEYGFQATANGYGRTSLEFNGNTIQLRAISPPRLQLAIGFGNMSNLAHILPTLDLSRHLKRVSRVKICPSLFATATDWTRIFRILPAVSRLEVASGGTHLRLPIDAIFVALGQTGGCPLPELSVVVVKEDVRADMLSMEKMAAYFQERRAVDVAPLSLLDLREVGRDEDVWTLEKAIAC